MLSVCTQNHPCGDGNTVPTVYRYNSHHDLRYFLGSEITIYFFVDIVRNLIF